MNEADEFKVARESKVTGNHSNEFADQNSFNEDNEDNDWQDLLGLAEAQWQRGEKVEALSTYDCALQLVRR